MWEIKKFSELTTKELFEILYLRTKIFVVDQKRIYQEVDDQDLHSIHIFDMVDGKIAAYARVFSQDNKVSFGRVVTEPSFRGQGLGNELMKHVLKVIHDEFPNREIEIEAQAQVQGFYENFSFEAQGDTFIFQHTPHIKMTHAAISA
ncbi:GNAT family N-acetyltransferase [Lactobacillus halodurans]|uniref:GNAT family N-acetyltransferase n=1 Tax=Companilactobacillus halodurans TaxID=2584183 RepID=A0A5P0ZMA5_9LACO|nr:GNAT family N-acetyltransferase [Companilactobacillus halodurans]MQS75344.1 GNAT family N-acetyltransferase [Companilactobacillus halodurans]